MKIINCGSLNVDYVYSVEDFVKPGETIKAKSVERFLGGKGLNQAISLSNAYDDVYFYCNISKNDAFLMDQLQDYHFNSDYINKVDNDTGVAFIQVNKHGENSIIISPNANGDIDIAHVKKILSHFDEGDMIVLQNEINRIYDIAKAAKDNKMMTVFNPSPIDDNINSELLKLMDYIVLNETEFDAVTQNQGMDYFKKQFPDCKVILTKGADGAEYISKEEHVSVDAYKTDVVDTTCAGDTFLGFFIGSIFNNKTIKDALQYASMAASICVGTKGASNSIPTDAAVIKAMKSE